MQQTRSKIARLAPMVQMVKLSTAAPAAVGTGDGWREGVGSSTARGYGYKWQQARAGFLKRHPLCCFCERDGVTRLAEVVDHITPHRGNESLFWDRNNWQGLCATHHSGEKQRDEAAITNFRRRHV
jgi:5-methylcytosine-specific restriction enzyme A